jgi:hypothetical protein
VFGNVGRNVIPGPGLANFNFTLMKNSKLREGLDLQFRTEFFNFFNRANFSLPNTAVFLSGGNRNVLAGRITTTATTSRQIQLALKLIF